MMNDAVVFRVFRVNATRNSATLDRFSPWDALVVFYVLYMDKSYGGVPQMGVLYLKKVYNGKTIQKWMRTGGTPMT